MAEKAMITREQLCTLIQEANEHHNLAISAAKSSLAHARDCGLCILDIKDRSEHGTFAKLIEADNGLDMNMRTAQRYMQAARTYDRIVEKMGPSRAATITLSEGLALIQSKERTYFPPDGEPETTRDALFRKLEPVDGTGECPKGGPHVYDEEACVNCHDPVENKSEAVKDAEKIRNDKAVKSMFARIESLYIELARQLDQLYKIHPEPYADKEGVMTALSMSYKGLRRWRYGKDIPKDLIKED